MTITVAKVLYLLAFVVFLVAALIIGLQGGALVPIGLALLAAGLLFS